MQVNIEFEPQVASYFKHLKYVERGALYKISTPFVANPFPPWNYSIRFILENHTTDWVNYTKNIKNVTLLKSFTSNTQIVHELRSNRNHTVLKQVIESIIVESTKRIQNDNWSGLTQTIIIAIIYLIFLLVSEVFYLYH
jgi:hypothetical protein